MASVAERRLRQVMLVTMPQLRVTQKLQLLVKPDNKVAKDFQRFFLPSLRYWNPRLVVLPTVKDVENGMEVLQLTFGDNSTHNMVLSRYTHSHQLTQDILEVEASKLRSISQGL